MAIYRINYRSYDGLLTGPWRRFWVIPRFALEEMRRSRLLALFSLGALIFPVLCALFIYISHSLSALGALGLRAGSLGVIDTDFFLFFTGFQSMLAFFLTVVIGPGLIAPDLANNGLTLYLARPITPAGYIASKFGLLMGLLSTITWVPGLILFFLQGYYEGPSWIWNHGRIFWGLLLGPLVWITTLSLMALALSAWARWKPLSGALLLGVFFVSTGAGEAINEVLNTRWGDMVNLSNLVGSVWVWLFQAPAERGSGAVFFRVFSPDGQVPILQVTAALTAFGCFCLWLLGKKIRAVDVVK